MKFGPKHQHQHQQEEEQMSSNTHNNKQQHNFYHHEQQQQSHHQNDDIYDYYLHNLIPALTSSLPILFYKLISDSFHSLTHFLEKIWNFLLPGTHDKAVSIPPWLFLPWNMTGGGEGGKNAVAEFILRHFDKDSDGHISASELLHTPDMNKVEWPQLQLNPEALQHYLQTHNIHISPPKIGILEWISHAWPMTDWKIGIFLWRTCGGLLCVVIILTIIPGKLHGLSGRMLRWPILGLTYFMITVELCIYILIRLFIRAVESIFANSHHRQLRSALSQSKSYEEWYSLANELDVSQNRLEWKNTTKDDTRSRYNWSFIHELIADLKKARQEEDSFMALAVLQQCTRKNVGGVMSEDLFTYMNTGETKVIVEEFVREVVRTLKWVTMVAKRVPVAVVQKKALSSPTRSPETKEGVVEGQSMARAVSEEEKKMYEERLQDKVKEERNKVRCIQGLPKHYEKKEKKISFHQLTQIEKKEQQAKKMKSRDLILNDADANQIHDNNDDDPHGLNDLIKVAKTLVPPIVWDGIVSPVLSNFDHDDSSQNKRGEKEGEAGQKMKNDENNSSSSRSSSDVEKRELKKDNVPIHEHLLSWATLNFFGNDGNNEKEKNGEGKEEKSDAKEKKKDDSQNKARSLPDISKERVLPDDNNKNISPPPEQKRERITSIGSAAESTTSSVLPPMHRETVKTFLKRARAAYGRTALCLSGGAMMGNYHFGSVKALLENDALPHIISGTSAGSAIGALLCTRTDEELKDALKPEVLADKLLCFSRPWRERIKSVWESGCMFDNEEWLQMIKWFTCGDLTFQEAYRKTGRVLCITLSATTKKAPPVLLNYVTAPDVVIASAIIASAAVPGFVKPVLLQVKDADGVVRRQEENKDQTYWDGSIEQDIPTAGLAEMLNCQFFLAAQANPHIVPFFYNSKGDVGRPSRWSRGMKDDSWRGGFLLSALELYLKSDMRAKFHFLNDLEAAVGFTSTMMTQQYGGTTTIVPQVSWKDYFKLFSNPTLDDLHRYFQVGSVAAYQHIAMVKLHYEIANALDECLDDLESDEVVAQKPPRRLSQLNLQSLQKKGKISGVIAQRGKEREYSLTSPTLRTVNNTVMASMENDDDEDDDNNSGTGNAESCSTSLSGEVDEVEIGGFEGVDCAFTPRRLSLKLQTKD